MKHTRGEIKRMGCRWAGIAQNAGAAAASSTGAAAAAAAAANGKNPCKKNTMGWLKV